MAVRSRFEHFCDSQPPSHMIIYEDGMWKEFDIGGDEPRLVASGFRFCGFCCIRLEFESPKVASAAIVSKVNPHENIGVDYGDDD